MPIIIVVVKDITMAYIRVKKRGNNKYFYLVESSRNGKKVKQIYLQYLGTKEPSQQEIDKIIKNIKVGKQRRGCDS